MRPLLLPFDRLQQRNSSKPLRSPKKNAILIYNPKKCPRGGGNRREGQESGCYVKQRIAHE